MKTEVRASGQVIDFIDSLAPEPRRAVCARLKGLAKNSNFSTFSPPPHRTQPLLK
jgi:hypothetical protein